MGAGKTSVGRKLSGKLRMDFYDLDSEVERAEDYSIALRLSGEKGGACLRLRMNVTESYPHLITHYSLKPIDSEIDGCKED